MSVRDFLEEKYQLYHTSDFIPNDPLSVPHRFIAQQDIEIAGFFAATIAWGNRKSIINSCNVLLSLMDNAPFEFIKGHNEADLKSFLTFKHRTFQPTDVLYFIHFLKFHYQKNESLESAFLNGKGMEERLNNFHNYFFSLDEAPQRTRKHVASPQKKSTCKRINMYLRWMVRQDGKGIDFGLWQNISPSELLCPFDVHVGRVSRQLGLVKRKQDDWNATLELIKSLRKFDPVDPARYDFALFGLGVEEKSAIDL